MMSKSHYVTNTCSMIVLSSAVIYGETLYEGQSQDLIRSVTSTIHSYTIPDTIFSMPIYVKFIYALIAIGLYLLGSWLPDIDKKFGDEYHRKWTHVIYIIPLLLFILSYWFRILFWLFAGYTLHLLWDGPSYCGVCYFYPISKYREYPSGAKVKKNHVIKLYRVGKPSEYILVGIIVAFSVFVFMYGCSIHLYTAYYVHVMGLLIMGMAFCLKRKK